MTSSTTIRVGVLCYSLMPATLEFLERLAGLSNIKVKAFPLFAAAMTNEPSFEFRPTRARPRFIRFNNLEGTAPEHQVASFGFAIARSIVRESDVVVLLGIQAIPALLTTFFAGRRGTPVVTVNQTMQPDAERNRPLLIQWLKRYIFGQARAHIAQTPAAKETLSHVYGVPAEGVVFAPFDAGAEVFDELLKGAATRESTRRRMNVDTDLVFLYVGSFIHLKGVDVLLKAFRTLPSPKKALWLIGSGPDEGLLRALAEGERVTLFERMSADKLTSYYRAADVFVLPTRKDMWPKVLIEAGLADLPIITTERCGAAGYIVRDGVNGRVVPVDDVNALASAMSQMFDEGERKRLASNSRHIISSYRNPSAEIAAFDRAISLARWGAVS